MDHSMHHVTESDGVCNEVFTVGCNLVQNGSVNVLVVAGIGSCFTKASARQADVFVYAEDDHGHTVSLLNLTTQILDKVSWKTMESIPTGSSVMDVIMINCNTILHLSENGSDELMLSNSYVNR